MKGAHPIVWTPELVEALMKFRFEGRLSIPDTAEKLGICREAVRDFCDQEGIPTRLPTIFSTKKTTQQKRIRAVLRAAEKAGVEKYLHQLNYLSELAAISRSKAIAQVLDLRQELEFAGHFGSLGVGCHPSASGVTVLWGCESSP